MGNAKGTVNDLLGALDGFGEHNMASDKAHFFDP